MTVFSPTRPQLAALAVPASFVGLAAAGYLALVFGARSLPAAAFAGLSSFYLLANTAGRGTFAALELELTRSVARARTVGESVVGVSRASLLRGATLLGLVLLALAATSPLLVRSLGDSQVVALLGVAAVGLALSSFLRGPLAGDGRYGLFAASLVAEAGVVMLGALALLLLRVDSIDVWVMVFALSPFAGALVSAGGAGRSALGAVFATRTLGPATSVTTVPALLWGSVLFLCSQGVWNLAPVVATGRADQLPEMAAGFAAAFMLLRAPVMVFPAIQALVLPRLIRTDAEGQGGPRPISRGRMLAAGVALTLGWMGLAIGLVPVVVQWLFATGEVPSRPIIAVIAAAILIGTVAQFTQARLLARGRSATVALVWLASLVVLLVVAALPGDPFRAATLAQLLATTTALVSMIVVLRRSQPA